MKRNLVAILSILLVLLICGITVLIVLYVDKTNALSQALVTVNDNIFDFELKEWNADTEAYVQYLYDDYKEVIDMHNRAGYPQGQLLDWMDDACRKNSLVIDDIDDAELAVKIADAYIDIKHVDKEAKYYVALDPNKNLWVVWTDSSKGRYAVLISQYTGIAVANWMLLCSGGTFITE